MIKTPLTRCNKLIDDGFSLITANSQKVPNFKWKESHTKAISKHDFEKHWNDPTTELCGIVTGFDFLEVIDIDLKVIPNAYDQAKFWEEFLGLLYSQIDDFEEKFVIYKTLNNGYHILYKCKKIGGNTKLAKLKGQKEAIIETRGTGGYVVIYDNQISQLSYSDIKEISELDRDIVISSCRTFNEPDIIDLVPKGIIKQDGFNGKPSWIDYNERESVWHLISDEFESVKKLSSKIIVKRNGAKSAHSGYIFDSNKLFLFSTGTRYPNEKPLSPFDIYTIKYHYGDYSAAAKELYKQGYGDRVVKKIDTTQDDEQPIIEAEFPIKIFPKDIQHYIIECHTKLNSSIDYMGCALLWSLSLIIGNSVKLKVKNGWIESATLWFTLVGRAGIGKTPSLKNITRPLDALNILEVTEYQKQLVRYEEYQKLSKKEQKEVEEVLMPVKSQFIVDDITREALVELHGENKNGIGVRKDELAGWYKDMNKYNEGSDLEFWLSVWSNEAVFSNRKTAKSSFVPSPIIPIIGGIQPDVVQSIFTEENKHNGFIDRMLICYPELSPSFYNEAEISEELIDSYDSIIGNFYKVMRKNMQYYPNGTVKPYLSKFTADSKKQWIEIYNEMVTKLLSDDENEYLKSMYPKQQSYVARFSLLLNCLYAVYDDRDFANVNTDAVNGAIELHYYFVNNAKKLKNETATKHAAKKIIKQSEGKSISEQIADLIKSNPKLKQGQIAELLGVSRQTVNKHLKK